MAEWNYGNPVESFMKGYKFWTDVEATQEERARKQIEWDQNQKKVLNADLWDTYSDYFYNQDTGAYEFTPERWNRAIDQDQSLRGTLATAIQTLPQFKDAQIKWIGADSIDGQGVAPVAVVNRNGQDSIEPIRDPENPTRVVNLNDEGVIRNVFEQAARIGGKDYTDKARGADATLGLIDSMNGGGDAPSIQMGGIPAPQGLNAASPISMNTPSEPTTAAPTGFQSEVLRGGDALNKRLANVAKPTTDKIRALTAKKAEYEKAGLTDAAARTQKEIDGHVSYLETIIPNLRGGAADVSTVKGLDAAIAKVDTKLADDPLFSIKGFGVGGYSDEEKLALTKERQALVARRDALANKVHPTMKTHDGYPAPLNENGDPSTEITITVNDPRINGGAWTNIPSLWQGKQLSQEDAVKAAVASGNQYKSYLSAQDATAAAATRSKQGGASGNAPLAINQQAAAPAPSANFTRTLSTQLSSKAGLSRKQSNALAKWVRANNINNPDHLKNAINLMKNDTEWTLKELKGGGFVWWSKDGRMRGMGANGAMAGSAFTNADLEHWRKRTGQYVDDRFKDMPVAKGWVYSALDQAVATGTIDIKDPSAMMHVNNALNLIDRDADRWGPWNRDVATDRKYESLHPFIVASQLGFTDYGDFEDAIKDPIANVVQQVNGGQANDSFVRKALDIQVALQTQGGMGKDQALATVTNVIRQNPQAFVQYDAKSLVQGIYQGLRGARQ